MSSIEPLVPLPSGERGGSPRARAVRFGATIAVVSGGLGLWQLHRGVSHRSGQVLVAVAVALFVYSLVHPAGALALRTAWLWLGGLLGRINSTILLSLAYLFILTPLSFLVRWVGRRSFKPVRGVSYFTVRDEQRDAKHFERPY